MHPGTLDMDTGYTATFTTKERRRAGSKTANYKTDNEGNMINNKIAEQ